MSEKPTLPSPTPTDVAEARRIAHGYVNCTSTWREGPHDARCEALTNLIATALARVRAEERENIAAWHDRERDARRATAEEWRNEGRTGRAGDYGIAADSHAYSATVLRLRPEAIRGLGEPVRAREPQTDEEPAGAGQEE